MRPFAAVKTVWAYPAETLTILPASFGRSTTGRGDTIGVPVLILVSVLVVVSLVLSSPDDDDELLLLLF